MMKLDLKGLLAIGGVSVSVSLVAIIALAAAIGEPRFSLFIVFLATFVLVFGATVLGWLLNARQLRAERVLGTNRIIRELKSLDKRFSDEFNSLRELLDAVRQQDFELEAHQRKMQNVLRSEFHTSRKRLAEIMVAQRETREGVGDLLEKSLASGVKLEEIRSLASHVRKISGTTEAIESRERKILNLLRSENRDSQVRADALQRALAAQSKSISEATTNVEAANVAVKKMHNFLRRDGSIQTALDRFTAAERRVLAAVETAGLDHADQVAALHSAVLADLMKERSELSRIDSDLAADLQHVRTELTGDVAQLAAGVDNLSTFVSDALERAANKESAFEEASAQAEASLDGRLRSFEEKISSLVETRASGDSSAVVENAEPESVVETTSGESTLLTQMTRAIESTNRALIQAQTGRLERFAKRQSIDVVRQVEALAQLLPRVDTVTRRYPPLGWWALPADTILFLSDYIERERPKKILEVGSGSSSVWIGTFAERVGAQVVSLEHDRSFAQKTRELVETHGLQEVVTVHHAALRPMEIGGESFSWYDLDVIESLEGPFDVLVVDGPPESTGDEARMPALPVLEHLLSGSCLVLLDDTHRPAEQEILRKWTEELEGFERVDSDLMRTGVMRRRM
ncbi:class I SAM-dependent methyltransferase [Brachybacterium massiliense]|uniref:class I SAM-dependent methyltransferase n=1 Tax=Brachybacterium massiliense TaxID=1755098 RepID=UPI000B3BB018|nr:class I SAM-dependent methyltransferase [Brachybacterium massiliense]